MCFFSLFFQSSEMPKLTEQLAGPLRQMQVNVFQFIYA